MVVEKESYIKTFQFGSICLSVFIVVFFALLVWQQGFAQKAGQQEGELSFVPPITVNDPVDGLFGSITISLQDYNSLKNAYIFINGEMAAAFSQKEIVLRVYDGDFITIRVVDYGKACSFLITKISGHINATFLQKEIVGSGNELLVGKVVFK